MMSDEFRKKLIINSLREIKTAFFMIQLLKSEF